MVDVGANESVLKLISKGAEINIKNSSGSTPLHVATKNGYVEIVRTLTFNNADVDIQNIIGQTCLHIAVDKGQKDVVKILTDKVRM